MNDNKIDLQALYRSCRRCRGLLVTQLGEQDADDAVHDLFLLAMEACLSGKVRNVESYTYGLARNYAARVIRRRQREREVFTAPRPTDETSIASQNPDPLEVILQAEREALGDQAVKTLLERKRGAL